MGGAATFFRNTLVATGAVTLLFLVVQHDREQRALVAKLGGDIQDLRAAVVESRAVGPAPVTVVSAPALDSAALEAVAVRAAHAAGAERATEAKLAAEANAPTNERLVAREAAHRTLEGALAAGRLKPDDVQAMRHAMTDDDVDGQVELRRQIAVAINSRQIIPDDPREIFP